MILPKKPNVSVSLRNIILHFPFMELHLRPFTEKHRDQLVSKRSGEIKLGEKLFFPENLNISDWLASCKAKFILLGVPEDIGPRANFGKPGASSMWESFLGKFLNMQHNEFLSGEQIGLLGYVSVEDLMTRSEGLQPEELRPLVEELDQRVLALVHLILKNEKIPIIIGGGHNQSFPLLKALSDHNKRAVNCLNIDPHADLRPTEGRHSGNGFSYAIQNSALDRYAVFGLHESYNSTFILEQFKKEELMYVSWDSILRGETSIDEGLQNCLQFLGNEKVCGIELDLDAIAGFPSSAISNSGLTPDEARLVLIKAATSLNVAYLHLPEGSPSTSKNNNDTAGKLVAYLVSDFIKAVIGKT